MRVVQRGLVVAVVAATLVVAEASPARACSAIGPLRVGHVWPPGGATAVPTNVRFVVTYDGSPVNAEQTAATLDLSVRPVSGGVSVPVLVRRLEGSLRSQTLVGVQPVSDLEIGQDYELLGRVGPIGPGGTATIEPTPVPLLRFRTGPPDRTAPLFQGATHFESYAEECDSDACCGVRNGYLVYLRASAPDEPALYAIYRAGSSQILALGQPQLFFRCLGSSRYIELPAGEYVMHAVDQAGNEDSNDRRVLLDLPCPSMKVDAGVAVVVDAAVADGAVPGKPAGDEAGCAVAAGGRGRTGAVGLVVLLGMLALGRQLRRRRGCLVLLVGAGAAAAPGAAQACQAIRGLRVGRVSLMAGLVIVIGMLVMTRPVARACTGPGAVRLSSVWPADGTTDVPANVRFVVRYDGVSTFAEQSVAMRALEIRPAGGGAAVPALVNDLEGGGRLVALIGVRPVNDLEVGKDYELAGRIAPCTDGSGMCPIEPTPVAIARFHTQAADHTPPVFAGATGVTGTPVVCEGACSCPAHTGYQVTFTVTPPAEPVLVTFREVGKTEVAGLGTAGAYGACTGSDPYVGPRVTLGARYVVRAVDRAGNEDDNQREVLVDINCPGEGGSRDGCAVAAGGRTRAAGFAGFLLVLAVLGLVWVRGRVYVARR